MRDRTKGHIEWSKYLKNTTIPEEEAQPSSSTHTVPPPVSYDAKSGPILPTLGFKAQETTTKRKPDDETGNHNEEEEDEELTSEETDSSRNEKKMKYF